MSNNDSNFSGYAVVALIVGVILYFWKEVLWFILDSILGIFLLIKHIITELIYIGIFFGVIYVIGKIYQSFKNN